MRRIINWYNTAFIPSGNPYDEFRFLHVQYYTGINGQVIFPDLSDYDVPQVLSSFPLGGRQTNGMPGTDGGNCIYARDTPAEPAIPWAYTEDFSVEGEYYLDYANAAAFPGSVNYFFEAWGFSVILSRGSFPPYANVQINTPAGQTNYTCSTEEDWVDILGFPIPFRTLFKFAFTYEASTGTVRMYIGTALVAAVTATYDSGDNSANGVFGFAYNSEFLCNAIRISKGIRKLPGDLYVGL